MCMHRKTPETGQPDSYMLLKAFLEAIIFGRCDRAAFQLIYKPLAFASHHADPLKCLLELLQNL